VKEQGKVIEEYRTQVLLPRTKIDFAVVQDLQLAPVELMLKLELKLELELTTNFTSLYNSL
jgi:hypothetical protein